MWPHSVRVVIFGNWYRLEEIGMTTSKPCANTYERYKEIMLTRL